MALALSCKIQTSTIHAKSSTSDAASITSIAEVLDLPEKLAHDLGDKPVVVAFDEFQEVAELSKEFPLEKIFRSCIQAHKNVRYVFLGSKTHLMRRMFGNAIVSLSPRRSTPHSANLSTPVLSTAHPSKSASPTPSSRTTSVAKPQQSSPTNNPPSPPPLGSICYNFSMQQTLLEKTVLFKNLTARLQSLYTR